MDTMLPKRRQLVAPEAIDRLHGARVVSREEVEGAVRFKIVLSKKELKKMVAPLGQRKSTGNIIADCQRKAAAINIMNTGDPSFEQMLHVLRKRDVRRVAAAAAKEGQLPEWQPSLRSIPEESRIE